MNFNEREQTSRQHQPKAIETRGHWVGRVMFYVLLIAMTMTLIQLHFPIKPEPHYEIYNPGQQTQR